MPITLYDIELDEVSLVDAGDNPEAKIVFWKNRAPAAGEAPSDQWIAQAVAKALEEDSVTETPIARESGTQVIDRSRSDFTPDGREIRSTETIEVSTSMEVVEIATAEAQKLMASEPGKYGSLAAARNAVWEQRPDLAKAHRDLPAEPARHRVDVPAEAPVLKGQDVIDRVTAEAQQLLASGLFKSIGSARAHVWATRPDLAQKYERARAS